MNEPPTPRTDAAMKFCFGDDREFVRADFARGLERELAEVSAAIHKVHPTRRGSLVDMVEDLDSYRETAMNAFRLSEKLLSAERALADRLADCLETVLSGYDDAEEIAPINGHEAHSGSAALAAWKEARREAGDPP